MSKQIHTLLFKTFNNGFSPYSQFVFTHNEVDLKCLIPISLYVQTSHIRYLFFTKKILKEFNIIHLFDLHHTYFSLNKYDNLDLWIINREIGGDINVNNIYKLDNESKDKYKNLQDIYLSGFKDLVFATSDKEVLLSIIQLVLANWDEWS